MSIFLESYKFDKKLFELYEGSISLRGDDAKSFLNSQSTNNTKDQIDKSFIFNALLDVSGKIVSVFLQLKLSENEFLLLLPKSLIDKTIERLDKFLISEDVEISSSEKYSYLICHDNNIEDNGYVGTYFFSDDKIIVSNEKLDFPTDDISILEAMTGTLRFGTSYNQSTLINNTTHEDLCVDYKKGCFLGQETVAKVATRRGAALKPVLIELNEQANFELDKIYQDKKIGQIFSYVYLDQTKKSYICAELLREFRIEGYRLNFKQNDKDYTGIVHHYPFLKTSKDYLAVECYDLAVDLFQKGDESNAVRYFLKAIELNPKYEDAYESLGVLYGRMGNFDKAIDLMEQLKELNPKCMMAFTNLSLYHMKLGNIETAEDFKSQATLLNFQLLGDEAGKKKQEEELKKQKQAEINRREGMYKQVLEIDDADAMANNGLGEIELERNNFEASVKYFSKAIEADSKYSVAYLGKAKSLVKLSKKDEAKKILESGIRIAGKNGDLMPANEMQTILNNL